MIEGRASEYRPNKFKTSSTDDNGLAIADQLSSTYSFREYRITENSHAVIQIMREVAKTMFETNFLVVRLLTRFTHI